MRHEEVNVTFQELRDEFIIKVQDTSKDIADRVDFFINEACRQIADEEPLPDLLTLGSVDTVLSQAYVNMPTEFGGELLYVGTASGEIPLQEGGLRGLLSVYNTLANAGDVEVVALKGNILWYQNIPDVATTLTLLYYKTPTLLDSKTDIPSFIPEALHYKLIVHKAAELAFNIIEDGIEENQKINTLANRGVYKEAVGDLRRWKVRNRINLITSRMNN